jgi:glycine/D-amino acid oxidase-like deaminating enzyme
VSPTREPIWNHCPTPVVASDAVDTVVGPAWDLVVVGAGIVGLCAALTARQSGRTVCVVDAGEVGLGVTGQATVKVTSSHGALAGDLAERHGVEVAVAYQRANDQGYAALADLVTHLPEDVGWTPTEHVVHAHTPHGRTRLAQAVRVSELAGSAVATTAVPPWATGQAWAWSDTAWWPPTSRSTTRTGTPYAPDTCATSPLPSPSAARRRAPPTGSTRRRCRRVRWSCPTAAPGPS